MIQINVTPGTLDGVADGAAIIVVAGMIIGFAWLAWHISHSKGGY